MHELASTILQHNLEDSLIDVPLALQHGTHQWPLGRFLRRKLRTFIGREANAPKAIRELQAAELQDLREAAWDHATSVTEQVLKKSEGRRIQIEAKIRRNRREAL